MIGGPDAPTRDDVAFELIVEALAYGPQRMRARGLSMTGAIPDGAWVVLQLPESIALGDVVAVLQGPTLLMHRVVGRRASGWFLLKGDSNTSPDGWFPPDAALAKVTSYDAGEGAVRVGARARSRP